MVKNETFEKEIKENEDLYHLLLNHQIGFSNALSKHDYSSEFKEYISDAYYNSFKKIYNENIGTKNQGRIIAFLGTMKILADESSNQKIIDDLLIQLEQAYNNLESVKNALNHPEIGYEYKVGRIDDSLSYLMEYILNNLDHNEEVKRYRAKILNSSLDILDIVSQKKPSKDEFAFAVNSVVMNRLKNFKMPEESHQRYTNHKRKLEKKVKTIETKYIIGLVIMAILVILKLLRFFR